MRRKSSADSSPSPQVRQTIVIGVIITVVGGLIVAAVVAVVGGWAKLSTWERILAVLVPLLVAGLLLAFWKKLFPPKVRGTGPRRRTGGIATSAAGQTQIVIQSVHSGASVNIEIVQAPDYQDGMPSTRNIESKAAYEAGRRALARGDYDSAIGEFSECLRLETDLQKLGAINIQIANCYYKQGKLAKAEEHYATARTIGKRIPDRHGQAAGLLGLGNVYAGLPAPRTSDRRKLLRNAIAFYEDALEIFSEEISPLQAANTQISLGSAYNRLPARSSAKRGDNLAKAVACFRAALDFYTEDDYPLDFANAAQAVATAYMELPSDSAAERADNVRLAIKDFRLAVKVYRKSGCVARYAMAIMGLGNAYAELPATSPGERDKNHKKAFACYKKALDVAKDTLTPDEKARVQLNLANAYLDLPAGTVEERSHNVRSAIACFSSALETYDKERYPLEFAVGQIGLGGACCEYCELPTTTSEEQLRAVKMAVDCFNKAIEIYDKRGYPLKYAQIQNNLGAALVRYPADSGAERTLRVREAIYAYRAALDVVNQRNHPEDFCYTAANLGEALLAVGDRAGCHWLKQAYSLRQFLPDQGEKVRRLIDQICAGC